VVEVESVPGAHLEHPAAKPGEQLAAVIRRPRPVRRSAHSVEQASEERVVDLRGTMSGVSLRCPRARWCAGGDRLLHSPAATLDRLRSLGAALDQLPTRAGVVVRVHASYPRGGQMEGVRSVAWKPGDRVVVESESTERPPRTGVIEEVVREEPPRYRIRWDDGRESIYSPAAGALRKARAGARRRPKNGTH
jgi:Domain of unknown function (DUF1918)